MGGDKSQFSGGSEVSSKDVGRSWEELVGSGNFFGKLASEQDSKTALKVEIERTQNRTPINDPSRQWRPVYGGQLAPGAIEATKPRPEPPATNTPAHLIPPGGQYVPPPTVQPMRPGSPWEAPRQSPFAPVSQQPSGPGSFAPPGNPLTPGHGGRGGEPAQPYQPVQPGRVVPPGSQATSPGLFPTGQWTPGAGAAERDRRDGQAFQEQQRRAGIAPSGVADNSRKPGAATDNAGLTYDAQKVAGIVDNSLYLKSNTTGFLMTGALTGAAIKAAEQGLDYYTSGIPLAQRSGWVKAWRDNLSPAEVILNLRAGVSGLESSLSTIRLDKASSEAEFAAVRGTLFERLAQEATKTGADKAIVELRDSFVVNRQNWTKEAIDAVTSDSAVLSAGKLFTQEEANMLKRLVSKDARIREVAALETSTVKSLEIAKEALLKGESAAKHPVLKGAGYGGLIAAGLLFGDSLADYAGSKLFGYKPPETPGPIRSLIDGVGIPLLLVGPWSNKAKVLGLAGSLAVGRAVDCWAFKGYSEGRYSDFFRPNTAEAVLTTAAVLAPIKNPWVKGGMIGLGYISSHLNNLDRLPIPGLDIPGHVALPLGAAGIGAMMPGDWRVKAGAAAVGFTGGMLYNHFTAMEPPVKLQRDAVRSYQADYSERTEASFLSGVAKGKALGQENIAALLEQLGNWQKKVRTDPQSEPALLAHRQTALISQAAGELWLEKGSRINLDLNQREDATRLLSGRNLDLGGKALAFLRQARFEMAEAQREAEANQGKPVRGKEVTDKEIGDLKSLRKYIDGKLDTIYGAHNIEGYLEQSGEYRPGCYDDLKAYARIHQDELARFVMDLKQQVAGLRTDETRFAAKLHRDVALIKLAFAGAKADGSDGAGAKAHFDEAMQYLQTADQLEAGHTDIQQMRNIASQLSPVLLGKMQGQYQSGVNNPFGVTPQYESPRVPPLGTPAAPFTLQPASPKPDSPGPAPYVPSGSGLLGPPYNSQSPLERKTRR